MNILSQKRSPDAAQRNPGTPARTGTPYASAVRRLNQPPLRFDTPFPDSGLRPASGLRTGDAP